ncbi:thermonuclease family protein [Phyllobacterium endophyticum]|uniref:thermonuclease family protein n=1 Tax=Phyllobacterium endophyticum TaxID=1149773 RepID=UPI0011CB7974|nr:thermonuclease family protein [Phyllobacterium endophyticum]TXR49443.1 thermonuclease family protein [Phyllobacterium endophyticum]
MSKQPRLISSNRQKKKETYSAPSGWGDRLGYEHTSRPKNVWAATVVLLTIVMFPTYAPMLIPDNASANAVAVVGQTITRQQLYVMDGDTILYNREKIRIANIDAPEIGQAKCESELKRGLHAKAALKELLEGKEFQIVRGDPKTGRMTDEHGRTLALILVKGRDIGNSLIQRQLARQWTGRRMPWC